jgi:hypothetical protein
MRTYLSWDMSDMPLGSTVDLMTVVLTVSSSSDANHNKLHSNGDSPVTDTSNTLQPPATTDQSLAAIDACLVTTAWADGGEGVPPDAIKLYADAAHPTATVVSSVHQEPRIDPTKCYAGLKADDLKTWTFTLTKIAQLWASGQEDNNGVALVPNLNGPPQTWTVEFHGYAYTTEDSPPKVLVRPEEAAKTTLAFTPPREEAIQTTTMPTTNETVFGTEGEPSFGNTSSPTGVEVAPPPAPISDATSPATSSPRGMTTALPASRRVKTPAYVWLGVAAGLLGVAALWRALAPEDVFFGAENRVAALLRANRQALTGP